MVIPCSSCPLRELDTFENIEAEEAQFLERLKSGELTVGGGDPIFVEGEHSPHLYTVLSGMGLRFMTLEDGRRQVLNYVMPGDFIGLQNGFEGEMRYSVAASTDMTLCTFNRADFWEVFYARPSIGYDLVWLNAAEEHFLGEALLTVGQRSAMERIAWAIVTLYQRMRRLGLLFNDAFPFPYRQQDLADTLGLSLVHTNKTLAKLREMDVARWVGGRIEIFDLAALKEIAVMPEFEPKMRPRPLL